MAERCGLRGCLWGAAAARTGDEMSGPALLLAGLAVTGSASEASALLAGLTVSAAVGGPVFGVLLDRSRCPGRLLAGALAAYAVALAVILAGLGRLPIALVVATAVLGGLLGPALSGGWTSQLPRVVTPGALPRANALDAMTFNAANLTGPVLAGAVAGLGGAPAGVVVAFALIGLAVPVAWFLPGNSAPSPGGSPVTVLRDLAAGFRALVHARPLARATFTSVLSFVGVGMLVTCGPLLGEEVLGSAHHGAFLLATSAASSLTANALLSRRPGLLRPDTQLWVSTLLLAAALLLAATAGPVLLVVAMVVAGLGEGPQLTALFAVRHREAPERLRGRIFTTGADLKITGFAVGAGLAGPPRRPVAVRCAGRRRGMPTGGLRGLFDAQSGQRRREVSGRCGRAAARDGKPLGQGKRNFDRVRGGRYLHLVLGDRPRPHGLAMPYVRPPGHRTGSPTPGRDACPILLCTPSAS